MRGNATENRYIDSMERPSEETIEARSFAAEQLSVDVINQKTSTLEARLSTHNEDSGVEDINKGIKVDSVAYYKTKEKLPAMAIQISTADKPKTRAEKMRDLAQRPFVRIEGKSVPKVLIFYNREQVNAYVQDQDLQKHPELSIQTFENIIKSLQFSLSQTKNPHEQTAINDLIKMLEDEKRLLVS